MLKVFWLYYLVICFDVNGNEMVKVVFCFLSYVIKGYDWCLNEGKYR